MTSYSAVILSTGILLSACQQAGTSETASSGPDEPAASAASASASEAPSEAPATGESEPAEGTVTVTVSDTTVGPALAGENGMTLYVLFNDMEDGSRCVGDCADAWPPFTIEEGEEVATGEGVSPEIIGTTTRPDGSTQVTFGPGRPLYYYVGDTNPGDANGHEVGGVWFVAQP